ncbi:MAG TPA: hypothetical protein PK453_19960 [Leptospiraceae bacterium]|nr:hypothetical protein [Leptospiraceae bacterium]HMY66622.1 hypothetical protein [Leptospiraceae bacterium]HNF15946.1 hypothetical protein [Leptospiraceae bacterium]HNF25731.1 hypothetical protein [Leptospiraceae bacterium]HNI97660.1 hypothetical protein [Leptospiraceae bacterium]
MKFKAIVLIFICFSCSCRFSQEGQPELKDSAPKVQTWLPASKFILNLADQHRQILDFPLSTIHGEEEIDIFFRILKERQGNLCEMIYGMKKIDRQNWSLYQKTQNILEDNDWLSKLILGCWNFYSMNDIGVEKDFSIVKSVYGEYEKDCYSVGFMQPYIMHGILGCKRIIFLDIDWKIVESHFQVFREFSKGTMNEGIDWKKFENSIEWDVGLDLKPRKKVDRLDYDSVCRNGQGNMCRRAIKRFIENSDTVEEVRFNLGFLHEGSYDFSPSRVSVVYMSNALDPAYTTKKEFKRMLKHLGMSMREDNIMVMIYHAGGTKATGVYDIRRREKGLKIEAVCRDDYRYGSVHQNKGESYSIYLDSYTGNREKIPDCRTFLKKKKTEI